MFKYLKLDPNLVPALELLLIWKATDDLSLFTKLAPDADKLF